jgi:predicted small lipoprotein YifL
MTFKIALISGAAMALTLTGCGQKADTPAPTPPVEKAPASGTDSAPVSTPTMNAYFGDTHIHTANSFDAYIFNVRATPDDAYRFAKGETIKHGAGYDIKLQGPPLDFLAVTDHGEYQGILPAMNNPDHPLSQTATAQAIFGEDAEDPAAAFGQIGISFVISQPIEEIRDQAYMNSIWAETVDAANRHNEPGKFTTFSGYEFTAMRIVSIAQGAAANLHRNVIFKDDAPTQLFSTLDSNNPEDLWAWMDKERAAGRDSLAIPHNSNASNGWMFAKENYAGGPMDAGYITRRRANEPLVEITQIKGTSETHPQFSPNDEWAGHEQYEYFIGSSVEATINEGDYVRKALARGLAIEDEVGGNPYEFGFIGASDTHLGAATLVEEKHWGKFPTDGAGPEGRSSVPPNSAKTWEGAEKSDNRRVLTGAQFSASGLAGVWAESNTRSAIFEAMQRKETFGTTGPRMKVRFFAGAEITADMLANADMLEQAYAKGAPMGGQIDAPSASPGFVAWAIQDPLSAPLQRLQIIKVWTDADGALNEAVYDAACSGGAAVDPSTFRCPDNEASVNVSTCETSPGSGTAELKTFWTDPSYAADQDAAYYVRALENPTCRWSTWDAVRNGTPPNPELPATVQERVWSSPIWIKAN